MEAPNFSIDHVEFPLPVIANTSSYVLESAPKGFAFYFMSRMIPYKKEWVTSLKRMDQMVLDKKEIWIVASEVDDGEVIREYGADNSRAKACDISMCLLSFRLEQRNPGYFMPRFLLGYPNIRGHCYLISALLPLLHSYPFVIALQRVQRKLTLERNSGRIKSLRKKKSYDLIEKPYYWCDLLYRIHFQYFKIAREGVVIPANEDIICDRIVRGNSPVMEPVYVKPKADLKLDCSLIRGLCTSLRNFCENDYGDAGGDERKAYQHILRKLISEDEGFENLFMKVSIDFTCGFCVQGPYTRICQLPILFTDCIGDIQTLLDNPSKLIKKQELKCTQKRGDVVCEGNLHRIISCKLLNLPSILCFASQHYIPASTIPQSLSLEWSGTSYTYNLFSYSKCFECWKSKDGVFYGEFYRKPLKTDISDGWHTYPSVRTSEGFIEVNNGDLYHPHREIQWEATPGSCHLYQLSKYDKFVPQVDLNFVRDNPRN